MHDPLTVAFEIRRPWPTRHRMPGNRLYWPSLITIWHKDPQKGGDEDSCNYLGFRKTKQTGWWPGVLDDMKNLSPEAQEAVNFIWWAFKEKLTSRHWWQHPKFHFWHWQIQIHVLNQFKRWLFSRCCRCGLRFTWQESAGQVVSNSWHGTGPRWFRSEENLLHMRCYDEQAKEQREQQASLAAN